MKHPLILIIDDDAHLTYFMSERLREEGYRVLCSESSEAGVALAREHRPQLILCDVLLPDVAGYDTVTALRRQPETAGVPVVLITVHPDVSQYEGDGKRMVLIKPFSHEVLVEVIKGTLAAKGHGKKPAVVAAAPARN